MKSMYCWELVGWMYIIRIKTDENDDDDDKDENTKTLVCVYLKKSLKSSLW